MKKRYLSDYTLEEQADPRTGKSRSVPKYRGRTYRFVLQGEKLRRTKLLFAGLTGGSVLALLAAFLTNAPVGHRWYVMMPLALILLPLFLQGESCVLLLRAGENVKRSERDRIESRTGVTSLLNCFFSLFSLAGHLVSMVLYQETIPDVVYLAAAAVTFACSLTVFLNRGALKTVEAEH